VTIIKTRIFVAADGKLSGTAPGLPAGDHEAEITLLDNGSVGDDCTVDELLRKVRAIQEKVARLPILDGRSPDEILGYNNRGHFD